MNEITYYWKRSITDGKSDEIIARSYPASSGFIFDAGKGYDDRDPVSTLRNFFATRHVVCDTAKELKQEVELLKRQFPRSEIYTTKESYR